MRAHSDLRQAWWGLLLLPLLLFGATGLVWNYQRTQLMVRVSVDGMTERVQTHQDTVGELLEELRYDRRTSSHRLPRRS